MSLDGRNDSICYSGHWLIHLFQLVTMTPKQSGSPLTQHIHAISNQSRTSVHDVRVVLKLLKAGLKLCGRETRGVPGRLRRLRACGRALTATRDAESRREIIKWLRAHDVHVPRKYIMTAGLTRAEINQRVREARQAALEVAVFVETTLRDRKPHHLERRFRHFIRRLTRARRQYDQVPSPENLHRLRKRVKDCQYQLRYWAPRPRDHAPEEKRLRRTGHDLGIVRDLNRLREELVAEWTESAALGAIDKLVRRRRDRAFRRLKKITDRS